MSIFQPREPMPVEMMELRNRVLQNRGLHLNFPYGTILRDAKQSQLLWHNVLPKPRYEGCTIRGFFYAAEPSGHLRHDGTAFRYSFYTWRFYFCGLSLRNGRVHFVCTRLGDESELTTHRVAVNQYYTFAVRLKSDQKVSAMVGEEEVGTETLFDIETRDWRIRIGPFVHPLLSLHISDELVNNSKFPSTYLGQKYYMHGPVLGTGSFVTINCIVTDTTKPLSVWIEVSNVGGPVEAQFPLTGVQKNDEVVIYIRSTLGSWLVTTSFDSATRSINQSSYKREHFIRPSLSDNASIVYQYCEQGAQLSYAQLERY